jgi:hypothetical protein
MTLATLHTRLDHLRTRRALVRQGLAWSALVTYQVGAMVLSGGSQYVCVQSNLNQVPPNATYWTPYVDRASRRIRRALSR